MEDAQALSARLRDSVLGNDWRACAQCIRAGADVNGVDESGSTPLGYAAAKGYTRVCAVLVDAGADPLVCDSRGRTALHRAVIAGAGSDTCAVLLQRSARLLDAADDSGRTPVEYAILDDRVSLVALFANMGCAGVEAALYDAAEQGREHVVRAIVCNAKALPLAATEKAFDIARVKGYSGVCGVL